MPRRLKVPTSEHSVSLSLHFPQAVMLEYTGFHWGPHPELRWGLTTGCCQTRSTADYYHSFGIARLFSRITRERRGPVVVLGVLYGSAEVIYFAFNGCILCTAFKNWCSKKSHFCLIYPNKVLECVDFVEFREILIIIIIIIIIKTKQRCGDRSHTQHAVRSPPNIHCESNECDCII